MLKLRAVAIVAGIVGIIVGPWMCYDNYRSTSWPTVEGLVQNSTVTPTPRNWRVELSYTYTLGERRFRGSRFRPSGSLVNSEAEARRIADSYPAGSQVTVHYDRDHPTSSALKTGLELNDSFLPLLGILGLTYGFWPRRKKNQP